MRRYGVRAVAIAFCTTSAFAADPGDPLYTNKPRFRIPFQFDAAEMRRLGASEIQLFVSTNQGQTWAQEQSVDPSAGKFAFEAPDSAEYWFAVRTIDGKGTQYPEGDLSPGLRVVVDTIAPTLNVNVEPLGRGRASLSWDAVDQNLDLNSLTIEWRDGENLNWQPVSILAASSGQTTWSTRGHVSVRASIKDLAGNSTEATDETEETAAEVDEWQTPEETASPRSAPSFRDQQRESQPDFSKPVAEAPEPTLRTAEAPAESGPDGLPLVRSQEPVSYFRQRSPMSRAVPAAPITFPDAEQDAWNPAPSTSAEKRLAPESSAPVSEPSPGASRRSVRARSFKVGYQLDDIGPSGVAAVDLYITEDGGRKWYHYGSDADRTSPFDVVVPTDGEYGFSIRVQSGVGVAEQPPQPGDLPDMYIVVDRTPPIAQILPLRQGNGAAHNQILIEWSLSDDRLAEDPVQLSYSEGPNGPWQPITGWTRDTGRHIWTITDPVRKQVYVKIEARDAAGNLTEARAGQPVMVDLSKPSARIVDVEADTRTTQ